MSTETSCHFSHLLQASKNIYIALGHGQTAPRGTKFYVNRNVLSLHWFVASLKKMSLKSDFIYNYFHDLIHVYSSGAGADSPRGDKILMSTERPHHFSHLLQVSKKPLVNSVICYQFQKNLFEVWFYTIFFHDLIHVYSPGAGGIQPPGEQSFDVNRKFWSLRSSVASFKS